MARANVHSTQANSVFDPSLNFIFFLIRKSIVSTFFLDSNIVHARLPSFGMKKGSKVQINMKGDNLSDYLLVLMNASGKRAISTEDDLSNACKREFSKSNQVLFVMRSPNCSSNWNLSISSETIIIPYFFNCQSNHSKVAISINYSNPNGFSDFREQGSFYLLRALSMVYPMLSAIWFINTVFYTQIYTDIHQFMTFLPLFKGGSLFLESEMLKRRNENGFIDFADFFATMFASVFTYSSVFSLTGMAISGWCSYRGVLTLYEFMFYSLTSIVFFVTYALCQQTDEVRTYLLLIVISSISALLYIIQILKSIQTANKLWWRTNDYTMKRKIELVLGFSKQFLISLITTITINAISIRNGWWNNFRSLIIESGFLSLFLIQAEFFFYRKEYIPSMTRKQPQILFDQKIIVIKEPKSSRLSTLYNSPK